MGFFFGGGNLIAQLSILNFIDDRVTQEAKGMLSHSGVELKS